MFVLDTNVISELRKVSLGTSNPNVRNWADSVEADELFISAITIMEIEMGVLRIERRDSIQGAILRNWLEGRILTEFDGRILPVDTQVARLCAALHVPDKRGERDALIAATAIVHGMTVVTRNVADFEPMGAPILNPWNAAP
jgi:predicted nucleic acid-binding protein